ncbi:SNF2-related protein [Nocardioides sp. DS6]|uniref:SNF2-related protein n=1 Tax=Nocardioides eburneus TaxID=3231482 RepID=A0ABV3T403_9ACTN
MAILDELTDAVLRESFDPLTLHRGREYAADGRVSSPRITGMGETFVTASANVAGGRPVPYRVQLTADTDEGGVWLMTSCSCPVRRDCKHGAALALTLAHPFDAPDAGPAWEEQLRGLLGQLAEEAKPDTDATPLALEVALESGRSSYARHQPPSVRIRPLRLGARGRWVKTGADWPDLTKAIPGTDFPRAQLHPMQELARAMKQEQLYWYAGSAVPLDDFGAHAVELIGQAAAGGVTLLPGPGVHAVEVLDQPVALSAQVRRAEGRTELRFGLAYADRLLAGPTVLPLGRPAHSVAFADAGTLRLARLSHRLTEQALALVTAEAPLNVPEADTARLHSLLGPLARLVPVASPDDSVTVPETPPPTLQLTVTWLTATQAALVWEWAYGERRYPLESTDDLGLLRDPEAESQISATVPPDVLSRTEATDGDALVLAIHDLPALRELSEVVVTERERPDFRESVDGPEIAFDLAEPEAGSSVGTDWLDLEVVIRVDGEPIPLPDVLAALTRGADFLVLPSGLYVALDRPEFAKLRDVVEAAAQLHERDGSRLSVGKQDLGVWAELAELGVVDSQAAEWVARAQALRDLIDLPRPEPTGVATQLRTYQLDGFWWLAFLHQHGLGGILADDMGLGKTLQVLALVAHAVADGEARPFLVVAPTSVLSSWEGEARRHTPGLRVATVTRRSEQVASLASDADLVLTTYAMLRLEQDQFAALPWAGLVLDEAQQVKNHQSKTYSAARRIEAPFRLAVTGTPFENRLMELWALLSIAAPGLYPFPRAFRDQVVTPVEKLGDDAALRRFRKRVRPFLLRRTKELVAADLPPKQEQVVAVELSPRHRKVYDAHLAKERQRILHLLDEPGGFDGNRVAILSALTRLRQLALDPALVGDDPDHQAIGSAKVDLLVDQLAEITQEGHKALVFSQFTSFLRRVRERLGEAGVATAYLDGSTTDRSAVIERFRAGEAPVFLISLKAGGVGLTLTEADYVYVLDPWWNPAAEAQAVDRAHRIGQSRHVMVYRLVSADTIEEKVMELKGRKAELFARVVDGEGATAVGIEAEDIRRLFDD